MNIWFRFGDKLVTPELTETILNGVTRNSIMTLAKDSGIEVEEKRISVIDLLDAYHSGELKEVFGTGTAVAVSPISSITFRDERMNIKAIKDSFALSVKGFT